MATKIEMTGACEAEFVQLAEETSRIVTGFPDGIARTITLRQWEWETFDRLQRDKGWDRNALAVNAHEVAVTHAPDQDSFEITLRYAFARFIKLNFGFCSDLNNAIGNDL